MTPGAAVLSARAARLLGARPGDRIPATGAGSLEHLQVVGVAKRSGDRADQPLAVMDVSSAQELLGLAAQSPGGGGPGRGGRVSRIELAAPIDGTAR